MVRGYQQETQELEQKDKLIPYPLQVPGGPWGGCASLRPPILLPSWGAG